jgi:outer membrane protein TolC
MVWRALGAAVCTFALLVGPACQSPLARDSRLDRELTESINREIASFAEERQPLATMQPPNQVEEPLRERMDELEAMGPATETSRTPFELGPDLTGDEQDSVSITLKAAIESAVDNNLIVESTRLLPAINAEDVMSAEAVFDFVLFSSADFEKRDQPQPVPVINGIPIGTRYANDETYRYSTGVRQRNTTGGDLTAAVDLTRFRNNSPGFDFSPDPAYTGSVRLGYRQPLLRNFGVEVNTSQIRLAENAEESSMQQVRSDLLDVCDETEAAYWDLVFAWRDVEISQWLVDVGIRVRDDLEARLDFDTTPAEYTDAVARVERRKAGVILARRDVRRASDRLKVLMNDPDLSIGTEAVLRPIDPFLAAPVEYNLRETIITALQNRPEIEQALLRIDDRSIDVAVTDNLRLPVLDLSGEIAYFGIEDDAGGAMENTFDDQFIDYVLGIFFEYPIGNRGAEAEYSRARLARTRAYVEYQRTVQDVVADVKTALRDVVTNYELIGATRTTRIASAENLRALIAEEPLRGLTPEFLDLKLNRQEALADARRAEFASLVEFDKALSSLHRAMGVGLEQHQIEFADVTEFSGPPWDSPFVDADLR